MFKEVFHNFTDSHLITFGFILFIATFLGSLIWTLFVQKKEFYQELSLIPLKKEDHHER